MPKEKIEDSEMRQVGAAVIMALIEMKVAGYEDEAPLLPEAVEHLTNGDMVTASDCFKELGDKLGE